MEGERVPQVPEASTPPSIFSSAFNDARSLHEKVIVPTIRQLKELNAAEKDYEDRCHNRLETLPEIASARLRSNQIQHRLIDFFVNRERWISLYDALSEAEKRLIQRAVDGTIREGYLKGPISPEMGMKIWSRKFDAALRIITQELLPAVQTATANEASSTLREEANGSVVDAQLKTWNAIQMLNGWEKAVLNQVLRRELQECGIEAVNSEPSYKLEAPSEPAFQRFTAI